MASSVRNEKCSCLKVTFFLHLMCNCISMYPISVVDKNYKKIWLQKSFSYFYNCFLFFGCSKRKAYCTNLLQINLQGPWFSSILFIIVYKRKYIYWTSCSDFLYVQIWKKRKMSWVQQYWFTKITATWIMKRLIDHKTKNNVGQYNTSAPFSVWTPCIHTKYHE